MIHFTAPVFIAALSVSLISCATRPTDQPTVPKLDAARYSGEWHEIARLPNSFEKNLVAAKAVYKAKSDGGIHVHNVGLEENGARTSIHGTARQVDSTEPGKLKVRFDPFPANLFEGDYWILDINHSYTRALVGSPNRKYLWLLSKNPKDGRQEFSAQIQRAQELGYDTRSLLFNPKRITH